jgi:hypothetical protein
LARFKEGIRRQKQINPAPLLLLAYIGMGRKNNAIALLQKAYAEHSNALTTLKVDPLYDPLRGDARFQELLQQIGLASPVNHATPASAP